MGVVKYKMIGKEFNEWIVHTAQDKGYYTCKCNVCGFEKDINGYHLRNNKIPRCPECKRRDSNENRVTYISNGYKKSTRDLKHQFFGELEVLERADSEYKGSNWICRCSCGDIKMYSEYDLISGNSKSCGHGKNKFEDLTGKYFGDWYVDKKASWKQQERIMWECTCKCGVRATLSGYGLKNYVGKTCSHIDGRRSNELCDLTGKHFGELEVLNLAYHSANGPVWNCRCSCTKELPILGRDLKSGNTKSCGYIRAINLKGRYFGEWEVIERAQDNIEIQVGDLLVTGSLNDRVTRSAYWKCRCSCGVIKDVNSGLLTGGQSKSCGCKRIEERIKTNLERYGVKHTGAMVINRTVEQISMTESKEKMIQAIVDNFGKYKPTIKELAELLGIQTCATLNNVKKYNIEDYVNIGNYGRSQYEDEIEQLFPGASKNNRSILNGLEIDLLYEDKGIAIEFNGNYWHSELYREKEYHKNKTLGCEKKGIQLIHIFQYEWDNDSYREKLIKILKRKLDNNTKVEYARKCTVKEIESADANRFADKYHMQGKAQSGISIGIFDGDNNLAGIMTFGKPRFNQNFQFELIRLAYRDDINIVGGSEKMLGYFKEKYKPTSIISYCDKSKFSGRVYERLGFKLDGITEPNYKWVNMSNGRAISRYMATKEKLIDQGLGEHGDTEVSIMQNLGFLRVYDCGNARYVWYKSTVIIE